MKYNKKIVSILLTLFMIVSLQSAIFADNKTLVLTGNLYYMRNGGYVLSIEDISALKALGGKNLGFKIKTEKKSGSESSSSEEVTQILGVRCVTEGRNSSTIYNAIQKMLVPSQDNRVLTLKYGASGSEESTNELENLLSGALSHKTENVIVEYFDNRVNGDSTVIAKVMYKVGKSSSSNSSSDSGFVVSEPVKNEQTTSSTKLSEQKEKKIEYSKILDTLKKEDKAYVRLSEDSNTQIPKKLLTELKWNKYNNKKIIFEKYNKDNLLYRWVVPVNDIHYDEKFDIGIETSDNSVEEILKDKINHYKIISFTEKNSLPVTCTIEIPMNFSGFDGSKLKILSVNLDKKEIEKKVMNFEIKDGKFIMKTGFGGNYIITDQDS